MAVTDWSHPVWLLLHAFALSFSENPEWKKTMLNFHYFILCDRCKDHYFDFINRGDPTYLETKEKAFDFTYRLHNRVNRNLNKTEIPLNEAILALKKLANDEPLSSVINRFENWLFNVYFPLFPDQDRLTETKSMLKYLFPNLRTFISDKIFIETFPACI